jgi:GNAT superfamily N-acetyltransferase
MIEYKKYSKKYFEDIITLTQKSISTARTFETWFGNDMTGILAFNKNKLIGILPLEKRKFVINNNKTIDLLWVSGAHVDEEYRNKGIGSNMDKKIYDYFYPKYKAVFVYRGDENSKAYNWYKKMNYHRLLPILSLKKNTYKDYNRDDSIFKIEINEIDSYEEKLNKCFKNNVQGYGGYTKRSSEYLSQKIEHHFYKEYFKYMLICCIKNDKIEGYALVGETNFKDNIDRFEIIEFITPNNDDTKIKLIKSINTLAYEKKLKELRIQISPQDEKIDWLREIGFRYRYRYNIMGKLFNEYDYLEHDIRKKLCKKNKYSIKIETPENGIKEIRCDSVERELYFHTTSRYLNKLLLNRCDFNNGILEGNITLINGTKADCSRISKFYKNAPWKFFQIEYI